MRMPSLVKDRPDRIARLKYLYSKGYRRSAKPGELSGITLSSPGLLFENKLLFQNKMLHNTRLGEVVVSENMCPDKIVSTVEI